MGGGAALRQHDAHHEVQVEARRLGRGQVVGDQHPGGGHPPRGLAGESPQHLLAHRAYVGSTLAQVGVGQPGPLGLDLGEAARPRGRRTQAGAEPSLDVGEHLGVGQQREVRVEDARLGSAHLPCGHDPGALDLPARGSHCLHDAAPVRGGLGDRFLGRRSRRRAQLADRADRNPGRRRQRAVPTFRCSRPDLDDVLLGLVEPAGGQRQQVLDRLLCLGSGRPDLHLVAADSGERGDPAQAGGRHRPGTGGEVAELNRRVEGAHLADQARGRPGVQAVRVLHREDPDRLFGARFTSRPHLRRARPGARPCP